MIRFRNIKIDIDILPFKKLDNTCIESTDYITSIFMKIFIMKKRKLPEKVIERIGMS